MGFLDDIKKVFSSSDEEYDEEFEEQEEEAVEEPREKKEPRLFKSKEKVVTYSPQSQMQVVLCKPERYDDVPSVADHLNEKKTVILNLESANRETSRRIIDFLSGVAYAIHGNIKKVANSTYIITPVDVSLMGELLLDDFENGNMYL
ncbi:MAG: cell division protein SepF [Clostridia bacterium]|nr:cell division protein SepF [Clostridia bacterium]